MKIGCLIAQVTLPGNNFTIEGVDQSRYDGLAQCSVNSFKKFHPEIELHYINDSNLSEYHEKYFKSFDLVDHIGIVRYMLAYDMMLQNNYDKIIVLGCDTITCARMDEFINNNGSCSRATFTLINWSILFDKNNNGLIIKIVS